VEIVLVGTADYSWAVRVFARLFNEHFGKVPVTWYGDREADVGLPSNFRFKRVPAYAEGAWPWDHHFGNGLRSILGELADPTVLLFLPDHWLTRPVDKAGVRAMAGFMEESGRVLRGNLTAGTCLDQYGKVVRQVGRHDVVTVAPTDHHCSFGGGLSFCPSLWNRELLVSLLEPHWDLWACEKVGTEKFARTLWRDGVVSAGVRPAPLHRCHGLSHAAPGAVNLTGLSGRDLEAVRGMVPEGWDVIVG
jgi:hypothetical protein